MSVKICVINLQKIRLSLAFFLKKMQSLYGDEDDGSVSKQALQCWKICPSKGTRCTVSHQRAMQCTVSIAVHCIQFIVLAVPLKYSLNGK